MLVLSRKLGEQILLSDGVMLTVVKVGRKRIRLGISAPKDIKVVRAELTTNPDKAIENKHEA